MSTLVVQSGQRTRGRRATASRLAIASRAAQLLSERLCLAGVVSDPLDVGDAQLEPVALLAEELVDEISALVHASQQGSAPGLADYLASAEVAASRAWAEAEAAANTRRVAHCGA